MPPVEAAASYPSIVQFDLLPFLYRTDSSKACPGHWLLSAGLHGIMHSSERSSLLVFSMLGNQPVAKRAVAIAL